jgi:hypothetical protein
MRIRAVCLVVLCVITLSFATNTLARSISHPVEDSFPYRLEQSDNQSASVPPHPAISYQTYLPVILNATMVLLFPNGNFEMGHQDWEEFSWQGMEIIYTDLPEETPPFDGSWVAWLGGIDDEISWIAQEITIPVGYSNVTYWYWVDSIDSCGVDIGQVLVESQVIDEMWLCSDNNTYGWVNKTVNISSFAGKKVYIQFRVITDEVDYSSLFIDYVSFQQSR